MPTPALRGSVLARVLIAPLCLLAYQGGAAEAQPAPAVRTLAPARLAEGERVVLDGVFDEAVWSRAAVADDFRQADPHQGEPAGEPTRVRMAYDAETLYVAAELTDSKPGTEVAFQRARDGDLSSDDVFAVLFDGFGDGRRATLFRTNPVGVRRDALIVTGQEPNYNWDGLWDVRVTRTSTGWNAEFAIPTRTLSFDPANPSWRVNFHRVQRARQEESMWSGWRRGEGIFRPQFGGKLEGLTGLTQGRGVEFRPYGVGKWTERRGEDTKWKGDAGFDLSWQLLPNLKGTLTYNTDFADTEVDERQVNLTRFNLFFPEKRAFFLDGANLFAFGPAGEWATPYYSRTIGINPDNGEPVPVLGGVRLAGEAGGLAVGALQLRTRSEGGRNAEDFTVARVVRNIGGESQVGAIFTRRAGEDEQRMTGGVDAQVVAGGAGTEGRFTFQPYYLWTTPPDTGDDRSLIDSSAFGARADYYRDPWFGMVMAQQVGASYDPALGFRNDPEPYRQYYAYTERVWRAPEHAWLRAYMTGAEVDFRTDLEDHQRDHALQFFPAMIDFPKGDRLESAVAYYRDVVPAFDAFGLLAVPAGTYETYDARVKFESSLSRPVAVELYARHRTYYTGTLTGYRFGVVLQPAPGLSLKLRSLLNDIHLESGDLFYKLYIARADYNVTTRHLASLILQYDNLSRQAGLQVRFRWIIKPGSELYVGYLQNARDEEGDEWTTLRQEAAIKAGTTLRW